MVVEPSSQLFINDMSMIVPQQSLCSEQDTEPTELDKMAPVRMRLFQAAGMPALWPESATMAEVPVLIPFFLEQPYDEICEDALRSERFQKADYVCFCHETVLPSVIYMPGIQLAQQLGHSRTIPLTLGQQGSLTCILGLRWLERMIPQGHNSHGLLAIVDQTLYPFSRMQWSGYRKGDMAVRCSISLQRGDFEILSYGSQASYLPTDMFDWTEEDYERAIDLLIAQLATATINKGILGQSDLLIVQQVSERWMEHAEVVAAGHSGLKLYRRKGWPEVNCLGSDPFLTLQEAVECGALVAGKSALLVFASVDYGIGFIRIRMHNRRK